MPPDENTPEEPQDEIEAPEEPQPDAESEPSEPEPETFPRSYVEELRQRTANTGSARSAPTSTPNAYTPSWSVRPAAWPTRPTSSSTRNTSATPTPWPPHSTSCWHASRTWRPAGQRGRSGRVPHPRPPRLTWRPFCGDEPNEKRPTVAMSHIVAARELVNPR